jgi:uncharacterized protein (DUF58 family)
VREEGGGRREEGGGSVLPDRSTHEVSAPNLLPPPSSLLPGFVFTRTFYLLLALGLVLLSLAWAGWPFIVLTAVYDLALVAAAVADYRMTESRADVHVARHLDERFSMGAENAVSVTATSRTTRPLRLRLKDEYPSQMRLVGSREATLRLDPGRTATFSYALYPTARGSFDFGAVVGRVAGRLGLVWRQAEWPLQTAVRVYPNIQEAKKNELYAHRNRELRTGRRRMRFKGQGREFESLREFVTGDEIHHIAWTATARRGKLMTREYRVEKSQNIVVMLDTGRLMTARIGELTKLDHAINATLSIAYVAVSGGDNVGLLTFGRRVKTYIPPRRARDQLASVMDALYAIEPQMIEPSYARAFNYLGANCRRRSLVVILTDLVDREASAELLAHTRLLIPRHLPLIVTIGDSDLRSLLREVPRSVAEVYRQSVAEELVRQREEALGRITHAGGLALDVPVGRLSFELVNKYLEVKERGLL